jgi:hypothetical protein
VRQHHIAPSNLRPSKTESSKRNSTCGHVLPHRLQPVPATSSTPSTPSRTQETGCSCRSTRTGEDGHHGRWGKGSHHRPPTEFRQGSTGGRSVFRDSEHVRPEVGSEGYSALVAIVYGQGSGYALHVSRSVTYLLTPVACSVLHSHGCADQL